jgi:hypothetical protein
MAQHGYHVGEHIRFYLPTAHPQHVRPRAEIVVELMGVSMPGAPIYAVVREDRSAGVYGEYVVMLPAMVRHAEEHDLREVLTARRLYLPHRTRQ